MRLLKPNHPLLEDCVTALSYPLSDSKIITAYKPILAGSLILQFHTDDDLKTYLRPTYDVDIITRYHIDGSGLTEAVTPRICSYLEAKGYKTQPIDNPHHDIMIDVSNGMDEIQIHSHSKSPDDHPAKKKRIDETVDAADLIQILMNGNNMYMMTLADLRWGKMFRNRFSEDDLEHGHVDLHEWLTRIQHLFDQKQKQVYKREKERYDIHLIDRIQSNI